MELIPHIVDAYSRQYTSPLAAIPAALEAETLASHPHAHMISGHVQGRFLEMMSRMIQPERILEIGTFTGFSAICLAAGLKPGGELHTIELRDEDAATARKYFSAAGMDDRIRLHTGDAKVLIPQMKEDWDLVFIDADKVNYIHYYELTLPAVKKGGWILADNVLFHGQVLEKEITGKNAKAIQAFNDHVAADNRVEQTLLTIRDGLLLIQKK